MNNREQKNRLILTLQRFKPLDLGAGTSGNASIRMNDSLLISPSGLPYDSLDPDAIVEIDMQGNVINGRNKPSSEWRFHRDIYLQRNDVGAIVHVHSPHATALACARQQIPAFHYMVAITGGTSIPCAPYAGFGTQELSDNITRTIDQQMGCLMANHGLVALGVTIEDALDMAVEIEALARQYILCLDAGGAELLSEQEMLANIERFKSYGKKSDR